MISFMADVIGIRDDMYIGKGATLTWPRSPSPCSRPTRMAFWITVPRSSLCSPIPTTPRSPLPTCSTSSTSLAASGEPQRARRLPSPGPIRPLTASRCPCPQSLISLLPRFGMDVTLAHPEGYDLMPEVVERAKTYAAESGTTFKQVNTMAGGLRGRRHRDPPRAGLRLPPWRSAPTCTPRATTPASQRSEKELLAQNATHQDWCSTTELMEKTTNGQDTIFMHPLPADISGVSLRARRG